MRTWSQWIDVSPLGPLGRQFSDTFHKASPKVLAESSTSRQLNNPSLCWPSLLPCSLPFPVLLVCNHIPMNHLKRQAFVSGSGFWGTQTKTVGFCYFILSLKVLLIRQKLQLCSVTNLKFQQESPSVTMTSFKMQPLKISWSKNQKIQLHLLCRYILKAFSSYFQV